MKIKETYVGFTDCIEVGRFAFFIVTDINGIEIKEDELVEQAMHFPFVVLTGEEVFKQKKEVGIFIEKLQKINMETTIQIDTKGIIKPVGIKSLDNVKFIVYLQLSSTGIDYNERIKLTELVWFIDAKSKFVFDVSSENDIDEAMLLIKELDIKKQYVYLLVNTNNKEVITYIQKIAKLNGVNYAIKLNTMLGEINGTTS